MVPESAIPVLSEHTVCITPSKASNVVVGHPERFQHSQIVCNACAGAKQHAWSRSSDCWRSCAWHESSSLSFYSPSMFHCRRGTSFGMADLLETGTMHETCNAFLPRLVFRVGFLTQSDALPLWRFKICENSLWLIQRHFWWFQLLRAKPPSRPKFEKNDSCQKLHQPIQTVHCRSGTSSWHGCSYWKLDTTHETRCTPECSKEKPSSHLEFEKNSLFQKLHTNAFERLKSSLPQNRVYEVKKTNDVRISLPEWHFARSWKIVCARTLSSGLVRCVGSQTCCWCC